MDVQPVAVHVAQRLAEADVDGGLSAPPARVCRATPVERIVRAPILYRDCRRMEQRIDGRRAVRVGRPGVVEQALQFLGVGQPPVVVSQIVLVVLLLDPGQGVFPVQPRAAVRLRPHQLGGVVGDRAVAVIGELVLAVVGVAAYKAGVT